MKSKILLILISIFMIFSFVFLSGCQETSEGLKKDAERNWKDIKSAAYQNGYRDGYYDGNYDLQNDKPVGTSKEDCMELADNDYCTGYEDGYWDGYNDRTPAWEG